MSIRKKQTLLVIGLFLALVLIDQVIKIYVKTHFYLRESVEVTSWFYLSFIENNGMAYGMEFVDKYVLTGFRILMTVLFGWILFKAIGKRLVSTAFVVVVSMILAGAVGNIFDCIFYGRWFTDSYGHVAQWADPSAGLMPQGEWFKGRVVDMFYFPLINFDWPDSFPVTGQMVKFLGFSFRYPSWLPTSDEPFMFFKPVFNFADSCITVGVFLLILFFRKDFVRLDEAYKAMKEERKQKEESKK